MSMWCTYHFHGAGKLNEGVSGEEHSLADLLLNTPPHRLWHELVQSAQQVVELPQKSLCNMNMSFHASFALHHHYHDHIVNTSIARAGARPLS